MLWSKRLFLGAGVGLLALIVAFFQLRPLTPERARKILADRGYVISEKEFLRSIATGDLAVVKAFLKVGMDPNRMDERGVTPLGLAVRWRRAEVVRVLLAAGADPNIPDVYGRTPLFMAVENNDLALARLLLAGGADPNHRDERGFTPLALARRLRLAEMEVLIRSYGGHL